MNATQIIIGIISLSAFAFMIGFWVGVAYCKFRLIFYAEKMRKEVGL